MNTNIGKFPPEATCELVVRCLWNSVIGTKLRNRSTHNIIIVRLSQLPCHQPSLLRCYFFSSCPLHHQASPGHLIRSNDLFFDALCWLVVLQPLLLPTLQFYELRTRLSLRLDFKLLQGRDSVRFFSLSLKTSTTAPCTLSQLLYE